MNVRALLSAEMSGKQPPCIYESQGFKTKTLRVELVPFTSRRLRRVTTRRGPCAGDAKLPEDTAPKIRKHERMRPCAWESPEALLLLLAENTHYPARFRHR